MNISNSIEYYIHSIKSNPMDFDARLALVQFYCLDGNWDKAMKTIQQYLKLKQKDHEAEILLKNNIECEITRLNLFSDKNKVNYYPGLSIDLIQHELLLSDLEQVDVQDITQKFLSHANQLNACTVILNSDISHTGTWLDTDYRFTDLIEVFVQNQYYVIPMKKVIEIKFKSNEFLTDMLWRRADIILDDSRNIPCFIPIRYPFLVTDNISDELKLSKQTDWIGFGDFSIGIGQKTITNGILDIGWLDIASIQISK